MQITKLDLPTQVDTLLNSNEGNGIVQAVKNEKERGVTDSGTSKRRVQMTQQIEALIKQQGAIFKRETEEAVEYITNASANSKIMVAEAETAVSKLQKGWDDGEAGKVQAVVPKLKKAAEDGEKLKLLMVNHQAFRAGYCSVNRCIDVVGKGFSDQLNKLYLSYRAEPLAKFMLVQDKFDKLHEYEKRGEHFLSMLPALKGQSGQEKVIFQSLTNDKEAVEKAQLEMKEDCAKFLNTAKSTLAGMKNAPEASLARIQELEKKLKVFRSKRNTATVLSDGFLKKAGPLASKSSVKDFASQMKKNVGLIDKDIVTMTGSLSDVQKAYQKANKK
jgi:hypothetical protein